MAQSKTVHPHDRGRFVRLSLVIIEELTPLLQDILQNEILPNQIFNQVSRHKSLFQMLRAEQIVLVQNAQNDGYNDFDITLTYTLLRNLKCIKVTAPTQGWGTSQMPGNGETTLGDDIERIRLIRNKIYGHSALPSLSETEFQEHWSNISDICKRMQTLLGNNYVQSLQTAEVRAIDMEMENTYLEKIKNLSTAEKSTRELLQNLTQDRAPCVEETVEVEAKNPRKRKLAETLTDTSLSILNDLKDSITKTTSDSEIELLYELIEEFIRENKEDASKLASSPFFEELKQKIKRYAHLKKSQMQTLARHFRFILKLKKMYGAELESSQGSLLLKLTFPSNIGYDLYMQDFERGEIGRLILYMLLYPPYLANFDLHPGDLIIYLNDNKLPTEIMLTVKTPSSKMLHPRLSAQDVLLCNVCEIAPLKSHCELCNISLCVQCERNHLSDSSKNHNVVPFLHRKSTPNYEICPDHADEYCKYYCDKCDIPVCFTCVSSGKHRDHNATHILKKNSTRTERLQEDLEELETRIYPLYEKMAFDVQTDKTEVEKNYGELTASIDQHGETLHQEITAIVNQRISAIQEMKNKHLSTLDKNTEEIERGIMELKQTISHVKSMLQSNDDYLMSTYKSRNSEFRTLPPKVRATFPKFSPPILNKHFLDEMCGSLSSLSINKEHGGTMESPEAVPHPPIKPLLKKTLSTAVIDTKHRELCGVRCLGEEVWTCGNDKFMKLLNLKGELLTSIQTKSGNVPFDIAVTREGDLVYTDYDDKTVNLVKNKQIRTVIKLQGWIPLNLCSTSSDDLMVIMISDDGKQSKIVRYSDATQKQIIQSDEQGRPLYSSYPYIKYISENGNLDICVADRGASAVVVVNLSGKLRFKYTGHPDKSSASFYPFGISTDSQRQILTADYYNDRIHILDQDGQFLQYIQTRTLRSPYGLCVDNSDNLFVAEFGSAKVKRIQYI